GERTASAASATIVLNDISQPPRTTPRRISPAHHPVAPPRPLRGHPSLRKEGKEKKKAARSCFWVRLRASSSARLSCFTASPLFSLAELDARRRRSEEHTSELQSRGHLVCRLLLEKKKNTLSLHT